MGESWKTERVRGDEEGMAGNLLFSDFLYVTYHCRCKKHILILHMSGLKFIEISSKFKVTELVNGLVKILTEDCLTPEPKLYARI